MSINKKIWYGDNFNKTINEDIDGTPVNPAPDPAVVPFTFDSMELTFDSIIKTFDEI